MRHSLEPRQIVIALHSWPNLCRGGIIERIARKSAQLWIGTGQIVIRESFGNAVCTGSAISDLIIDEKTTWPPLASSLAGEPAWFPRHT